MEETKSTQFVINSTVKPNSFEHGSAGNRHKIFYDNPVELELHIKALKDKGLWEESKE